MTEQGINRILQRLNEAWHLSNLIDVELPAANDFDIIRIRARIMLARAGYKTELQFDNDGQDLIWKLVK